MKSKTMSIFRCIYLSSIALLFVLGCQNQDYVDSQNDGTAGLTILEAKEHFERVYSNNSLREGSRKQKKKAYDEKLEGRKIKWEKAYNRKLSRGESVMAPIDFGKVLYKFKDQTTPTYVLYDYLNYAYMYKDSNKVVHTEWVTLVPDTSWFNGKGSYTGTILIRNWEGDFLKVFKYVDNKEVEALNVVDEDDITNGRTNAFYVFEICVSLYDPTCPGRITAPGQNDDPGRCVVDFCKTINVDPADPEPPVGGTPGGGDNNGGGPSGGGGGGTGGGDYVPACNPNVPAGTYPPANQLPGCWMWAVTPITNPNDLIIAPNAYEYWSGTSNVQDNDWTDATQLYSPQNRPAWNTMYGTMGYPRQFLTHPTWDKVNSDVYNAVGGDVLTMALAEPAKYKNACALRVSVALNASGINIPNLSNRTYRGANGKYYFLSVAKLYKFCKDTFGAPHVVIKPMQTSNNVNYMTYLNGLKGIYIMQAANPGIFGAEGHATLFNGTDAVKHSNGDDAKHFNGSGGTHRIFLWKLP